MGLVTGSLTCIARSRASRPKGTRVGVIVAKETTIRWCYLQVGFRRALQSSSFADQRRLFALYYYKGDQCGRVIASSKANEL